MTSHHKSFLVLAPTANVPLCGNGIIDKQEDCDGGGMGLSGLDTCCSANCKFIKNATCRYVNQTRTAND